jgi:hypothetical protein
MHGRRYADSELLDRIARAMEVAGARNRRGGAKS